MSKRAKMTADKARERINKLEESIAARESKLETLKARLSRTPNPDEKLLSAQSRLERRLGLEQEQVQKLKRLLSRHADTASQESSEYFDGEDIEDLHRSFEEVRQDLSVVKSRLESADLPRDLPSRLTSFEERIKRREEVSSDLYSQILNLENALDQERQTVRRLSRKIREQDQNLDALREAVEDSVMATVDMVERLDELEEGQQDSDDSAADTTDFKTTLESLHSRIQELESQIQAASTNNSEEILLEALDDFDSRLEGVEQVAKSNADAVRFVSGEMAAVSARAPVEPAESTPEPTVELTPEEMVGAFSPPEPAEMAVSAQPSQIAISANGTAETEHRITAVFASGLSGSGVTAGWKPARFDTKKSRRFL